MKKVCLKSSMICAGIVWAGIAQAGEEKRTADRPNKFFGAAELTVTSRWPDDARSKFYLGRSGADAAVMLGYRTPRVGLGVKYRDSRLEDDDEKRVDAVMHATAVGLRGNVDVLRFSLESASSFVLAIAAEAMHGNYELFLSDAYVTIRDRATGYTLGGGLEGRVEGWYHVVVYGGLDWRYEHVRWNKVDATFNTWLYGITGGVRYEI